VENSYLLVEEAMMSELQSSPTYSGRLQRLQQKLVQQDVDALLIGHLKNIRYLTGFTGTAGYLLVTPASAYLYVDGRYTVQARAQTSNVLITETARDVLADVIVHLNGMSLTACGFESARLYWSDFKRLEMGLQEAKLVPTRDAVEVMRFRKDEGEIAALRKAVAIADAAYADFLTWLMPGMSEIEVAARLEYFQRRQGGDRKPSETAVASGTRTALAHGIATDREIQFNEPVMIDIGIVVAGYTSDMTRTVHVGEPPRDFVEVYDIVREAQARAIKGIRPGMTGREVDALARDYIAAHNYGAFFGHGLGHSVGLEIHEAPYLSMTGDIPLEPGMVVTVEPGIYLPGRFGVRTEDIVLVTEAGCEVLTASEHRLQVV
jgi:Xaa-Pro aminopeptidase